MSRDFRNNFILLEKAAVAFHLQKNVLLLFAIISYLFINLFHPTHYCNSGGKYQSLVLDSRMMSLFPSSGCQESRPAVGNSCHVSALRALHTDSRRQTKPLPPISRLWDALLRRQAGRSPNARCRRRQMDPSGAGIGDVSAISSRSLEVHFQSQGHFRKRSSHQFSGISCLMFLIRFSGFRWRTRSATYRTITP